MRVRRSKQIKKIFWILAACLFLLPMKVLAITEDPIPPYVKIFVNGEDINDESANAAISSNLTVDSILAEGKDSENIAYIELGSEKTLTLNGNIQFSKYSEIELVGSGTLNAKNIVALGASFLTVNDNSRIYADNIDLVVAALQADHSSIEVNKILNAQLKSIVALENSSILTVKEDLYLVTGSRMYVLSGSTATIQGAAIIGGNYNLDCTTAVASGINSTINIKNGLGVFEGADLLAVNQGKIYVTNSKVVVGQSKIEEVKDEYVTFTPTIQSGGVSSLVSIKGGPSVDLGNGGKMIAYDGGIFEIETPIIYVGGYFFDHGWSKEYTFTELFATGNNSNMKIKGNVQLERGAKLYAEDFAKVDITGDVLLRGGAPSIPTPGFHTSLYAKDSSSLKVNGKIFASGGIVIQALNNSVVDINGGIIKDNENALQGPTYMGLTASDNSIIKVVGDVNFSWNGEVSAHSNSKIIVEGNINIEEYSLIESLGGSDIFAKSINATIGRDNYNNIIKTDINSSIIIGTDRISRHDGNIYIMNDGILKSNRDIFVGLKEGQETTYVGTLYNYGYFSPQAIRGNTVYSRKVMLYGNYRQSTNAVLVLNMIKGHSLIIEGTATFEDEAIIEIRAASTSWVLGDKQLVLKAEELISLGNIKVQSYIRLKGLKFVAEVDDTDLYIKLVNYTLDDAVEDLYKNDVSYVMATYLQDIYNTEPSEDLNDFILEIISYLSSPYGESSTVNYLQKLSGIEYTSLTQLHQENIWKLSFDRINDNFENKIGFWVTPHIEYKQIKDPEYETLDRYIFLGINSGLTVAFEQKYLAGFYLNANYIESSVIRSYAANGPMGYDIQAGLFGSLKFSNFILKTSIGYGIQFLELSRSIMDLDDLYNGYFTQEVKMNNFNVIAELQYLISLGNHSIIPTATVYWDRVYRGEINEQNERFFDLYSQATTYNNIAVELGSNYRYDINRLSLKAGISFKYIFGDNTRTTTFSFTDQEVEFELNRSELGRAGLVANVGLDYNISKKNALIFSYSFEVRKAIMVHKLSFGYSGRF